MSPLMVGSSRPLHAGELYRLENGVSQWIGCDSGTVWISQAVEPRDIVLAAGDSLLIESPRQALIGSIGGPATVWTDAALETASAA